jgi:hypothetical protein
MRMIIKGLVVAAVAATLAACGAGASGTPERPAGTPEVRPSWTSCAAEVPERTIPGVDAIALPRLADQFIPSAAIVCDSQPQRRADGGQDLVAFESRADDVTELVAALRLPDQPRTAGACTMDLPIVAWFALLDAAGQWLRPGLPTDACGKIRIEVRKAVGALRLTRISSHTVAELESAGAVAAGCGQMWADMVSVETSQKRATPGAAFASPFVAGAQVRLCAYRVPASEQGSGKPAGTFEHGGILATQRWAAIANALAAAGGVRECSTHAGRFALLRSDGTAGEVYVELDGCLRIMATRGNGPPSFAQADAALVELLST